MQNRECDKIRDTVESCSVIDSILTHANMINYFYMTAQSEGLTRL